MTDLLGATINQLNKRIMEKEFKQKANAIKEELLSLEVVKGCYDVQVHNYCYDAYIISLSEKEKHGCRIHLPLTIMEVIVKHQLQVNIQNVGDGKNYMRINIWVK